ncbi:aminotransferase class I/II-fold pyridoxal phosphate-dependent enzyme [Candidatus Dependentiae bacterium]|nr:aminotransferase class I/II-fold pyridoxal phosphate-dependent enzyme [Candidatus Dependentiae bacterium]
MLNIPLSGIKKIESIARSSDEYVSLSQGALKVGGIPLKIKEHVQEILKTDKTDYYQSAWGIFPLREKLAQILNKKYNANLSNYQVMVSHGAIGALSSLFLTLLEPEDEVILPEPTYPAYEKLTYLARCKPIFVSTLTNNDTNFWQLDLEKIKKAVTNKTKIIVFSNPWNPLGLIIDKNKIKELLNWCEKKGIYLIVDEAYKRYAFDQSYKSCIDLVNQSEFFITVNSFSKNMAMSGWRVGYMVIPEKLNFPVGRMQDALLNCPNVPAQYAALFALDHDEFTINFHSIIKNNLELTCQLLEPLVKKEIFSYQKPKGSFFIFLKTKEDDSENLCMDILKRAKVSLIPGKFFGESGKSFLRLCYARDEEIIKEGLNRLNNYFLESNNQNV